jgi:hypothetical protein
MVGTLEPFQLIDVEHEFRLGDGSANASSVAVQPAWRDAEAKPPPSQESSP